MPPKKTPKQCEFVHNQKGFITKVLIPINVLDQEFDTSLMAESPLFEIYQYITEHNEKNE